MNDSQQNHVRMGYMVGLTLDLIVKQGLIDLGSAVFLKGGQSFLL